MYKMKHIKYFLQLVVVTLAMAACEKVENLPYYNNGSPVTLTSSAGTVSPSVADSNNAVVSFNWTSPNYATAEASYKYLIQLDTAGGNFVNPFIKEVTGLTSAKLSTSFTGKELNNILVAKGLTLGKEAAIIARVVSSYNNNNEQLVSNVLNLKMTPYGYAFPLNASDAGPFVVTISNKDQVLQTFGWNKPDVGVGSYTYVLQYAKASTNFADANGVVMEDVTSYGATGADLNRFAREAGIPNGVAGEVEFRVLATLNGRQSFASAIKKYTITPNELMAYLYVPGDYQNWSPNVAPKLASVDDKTYEGYVNLTSTNGFKFTEAPDWDHTAYGDAGEGKISSSGGNITLAPAGYYLLKVNLAELTWTSTLINSWGVIGDATPGGWDNSTPLVYDEAAKVWKATITFSGSGAFKFRANNGWDINLGGTGEFLNYGGDNINSPSAGAHLVTLDLSNPLRYTYTVQ
jgi:hypothetical protein